MNKLTLAAVFFMAALLTVSVARAAEGLVNISSAHSVGQTADRLVSALQAKGMTIFARINHAAGAARVGHDLRPTEIIVFGNPKVGSPLMSCQQTVAIDLPQKALIWEDENGRVWLSYNDPQYLRQRHGVEGCDAVLQKVQGALAKFAQAATKSDETVDEQDEVFY